jgi:hypothetical protein
MRDYAVLTYALYAAITIPLTLFVARTLSANGRHFLVDVFKGNDELAKAVNQLLVVGFYLLNLGFVAFFLASDRDIESKRRAIEELSTKVGTVAIVIGIVHFANIIVLNKYRNRALHPKPATTAYIPPITATPTGVPTGAPSYAVSYTPPVWEPSADR